MTLFESHKKQVWIKPSEPRLSTMTFCTERGSSDRAKCLKRSKTPFLALLFCLARLWLACIIIAWMLAGYYQYPVFHNMAKRCNWTSTTYDSMRMCIVTMHSIRMAAWEWQCENGNMKMQFFKLNYSGNSHDENGRIEHENAYCENAYCKMTVWECPSWK